MSAPNSATVYVQDETDHKYCHSSMRIDLVPGAVKHAREWLRYVRAASRRGTYRGLNGERLYGPCGRCRVIVEEYFDDSAP